MSKLLFSPAVLGSLKLANKVVMAPMTRSRALGNVPNELMVKYYEQRASAGLIITEGTAPSVNGLGYARIPGLYSQQQVDGWKKVIRSSKPSWTLPVRCTRRIQNLNQSASLADLNDCIYSWSSGHERRPCQGGQDLCPDHAHRPYRPL